MTYTLNCERCVNRKKLPDRYGAFHEFCTAITDKRAKPICFNKFKQEVTCDEYVEDSKMG